MFDLYEEVPDAFPLEISSSGVKVVLRRLGGDDSLGGADANILKDDATASPQSHNTSGRS